MVSRSCLTCLGAIARPCSSNHRASADCASYAGRATSVATGVSKTGNHDEDNASLARLAMAVNIRKPGHEFATLMMDLFKLIHSPAPCWVSCRLSLSAGTAAVRPNTRKFQVANFRSWAANRFYLSVASMQEYLNFKIIKNLAPRTDRKAGARKSRSVISTAASTHLRRVERAADVG